ncbi:MAG: hypothetical protein AB7F59_10600 [Bdellovibrionales bacterium]
MNSLTLRTFFVATIFLLSACQNSNKKVLSSGHQCSQPGKQITAGSFDWDDNIAYLPTPGLLYKKSLECKRETVSPVREPDLYKMGEQCVKRVSTEEFTEMRHVVGKKGMELEDYEIDASRSFWYFRDNEGMNWFDRDVKAALKDSTREWRGPSWKAFVAALSDKDSSEWTSIITARGHSQEFMHQTLKYLQHKKLITHLPPQTSLHAVSHPNYTGTASNPSEAKTQAMKDILDCMSRRPLSTKAYKVVTPNSKPGEIRYKALHLWGFSDDDWGNYEKAQKVLSDEVAKGRWSNIKITLFYTGKMKRDEKGQIVPRETTVIQSSGKLRPQMGIERNEPDKIVLARKR